MMKLVGQSFFKSMAKDEMDYDMCKIRKFRDEIEF